MSQTPPPMRVETIGYRMPAPGRPGILTAVGVVSIAISSLSMIMACGGVAYALMFGMLGAPRMVPPPTTSQTMPEVIVNNSRGMPLEQRRVVEAAMSGRVRLSAARQEMLDKLLAEAGSDMFFGTNYDVNDSGRLPGVGNLSGNDYFVIGRGRIELADDSAVFSPTSGEAVRVNSNAPSSLLISHSVSYSASPAMAFPISGTVSRTSAVFYGITAVCNLLLAIVLLIGGILVLRNSRRGRPMHLIYASLKIPVAVAEACAYVWMMNRMMIGFTAPGMPSMSIFMAISSALQGAVACAYPVALLIVMNRRTIKEYYSQQIAR